MNDISPIPQKERKKKSIRDRAFKAEVLTSSPYKKQLDIKSSQSKIKDGSRKSKNPSNDERLGKKRKNVKPGVCETKGRERKSKKLKSKHDDDVNCIVCRELFSESRPGVTCVMCVVCANWAHLQCRGLRPMTAKHTCATIVPLIRTASFQYRTTGTTEATWWYETWQACPMSYRFT